MTTSNVRLTPGKEPGAVKDLMRGAFGLLWLAIRLPVFTFLVILEPVVRVLLATIALFGILLSFFFKFSGAAPHFPFWLMLAMSVGFGLALVAYNGLIRLFSR
jgi:hypothetical protein